MSLPPGHKQLISKIGWSYEPKNLLVLADKALSSIYDLETGRPVWMVSHTVDMWPGLANVFCFEVRHHTPGRPPSDMNTRGSSPVSIRLRCGAQMEQDAEGRWSSKLLLQFEDADQWEAGRVEWAALATVRRMTHYFAQRNLLPPGFSGIMFGLVSGPFLSPEIQRYGQPGLNLTTQAYHQVILRAWGGADMDLT